MECDIKKLFECDVTLHFSHIEHRTRNYNRTRPRRRRILKRKKNFTFQVIHKKKNPTKFTIPAHHLGELRPMSIPLKAIGAYIHRSSELSNCEILNSNQFTFIDISHKCIRKSLKLKPFAYLNLELQKFDVMNSFLKHRTDIDLYYSCQEIQLPFFIK